MSQIPNAYAWLTKIGQLPRTISEGLKLLGVAEIAGRGSNRTILAWRDELNAAGVTISGYSDDDIPWCGLFAAIVAHRAGKVVPLKPLWARNWAKFGTLSVDAALGDVLVFERPGGGGHVGFYVAEDDTAYHVLGGNQGNRVSITRIAQARCIAHRRPVYSKAPASVVPRVVKASGALSRNEA
ncbi:TIGR02594 family protein [Novosphingobium sp.]|uniref:TIGR02594 family protein n=1 Tax=Novosphingobium sp. TaxID=1874826 RepID=UPI001EB17554|nr:TIGR02594 family protein [Novosphingobium sp.]MBK6801648.1 TIGR02594 family protein [Novosphingobium sp.]MBK9009984.1 TIGR02594 family protein [Novosphingobium sp.]